MEWKVASAARKALKDGRAGSLGWNGLLVGVTSDCVARRFWWETTRKSKARGSPKTTYGPNNQEVTMNPGPVRTVHIRVTIVFNWKTMGVMVSAYLIRLLIR